jgi:hypothetical protein
MELLFWLFGQRYSERNFLERDSTRCWTIRDRRSLERCWRAPRGGQRVTRDEDLASAVRQRYAEGDITREQYLQMLGDLRRKS